MFKLRYLVSSLFAIPTGLVGTPALAQEGSTEDPGWDADISLNAVSVESGQTGADDLDTSGLGARASLGYEAKSGTTDMRLEVDASVFDYSDALLPTRNSYGGKARITHSLGKNVKASVEARYGDNVVTLESLRTDQKLARAQLSWEKGKNQVTGYAEHRWRDYAGAVASKGKGLRAGAQFRHRIASWHWVRFDLSKEKITSANAQRGFKRVSASIDYSRPIVRNLRLTAGIDARRWTYDGRLAQGAAPGVLRKDKLIAPEIGLSFGRPSGVYATGRASYQFRQSNDTRFGKDGPRLAVAVGFRF